jgi:hypothetical protein
MKRGHYLGRELIRSMHHIRDEWGMTRARRATLVRHGHQMVPGYGGAYRTHDLVWNSAFGDL